MRLALTIAAGAALMSLPELASFTLRAMEPRPVFACDTDAECAALPPCALKPGCDGGPDSEPFRLVGYGCQGHAGRLFADEEDSFPPCRYIVPTFPQGGL